MLVFLNENSYKYLTVYNREPIEGKHSESYNSKLQIQKFLTSIAFELSMALVARSKVKEIVGDFNISNEFFPAIDKKVTELIKESVNRAKKNQRRTVMARDI
jgi:histone H3/H4